MATSIKHFISRARILFTGIFSEKNNEPEQVENDEKFFSAWKETISNNAIVSEMKWPA